MNNKKTKTRIALIGGGPSSLFVLKRLIELKKEIEIEIFERKKTIGAGMPYSEEGANPEHITNVSDNEIPEIVTSIRDWIDTLSDSTLEKFSIDRENFTQFHVLPRLFFGQYLSGQFQLLVDAAAESNITLRVHTHVTIDDIVDLPDMGLVKVVDQDGISIGFNAVVICSGHNWPKKNEGKIPGYYDSPYPPVKLRQKLNHKIAIKGSSLTAIDAIRTLARHNGSFERIENGKLLYVPDKDSPKFKMVMHSRNGLLPAIRFHLDEPQLSNDSLLTNEEVENNRQANNGFLSLDYVFRENFIKGFRKKDPAFYKLIKDMKMEAFVEAMMEMREGKEPFELFRQEYREAEKSIKERKSIYWKEMLAELSYTMNYPAKYLSAEDMLRLKKVLSPLISVVIAFAPQNSCDELFALHDAGKLDIVSVGEDSIVKPVEKGGIIYKFKSEDGKSHAISYQTYIDCSGQPHLSYDDFPFESLRTRKSVCPAVLRFKSNAEAEKLLNNGNEDVIRNANGDYFLKVPGITINDNFQIVNEYGVQNNRIFTMAVPYIGGYNPDYSGLDFSEEASRCIVEKIGMLIDSNVLGGTEA